jgi:hypothetical protein
LTAFALATTAVVAMTLAFLAFLAGKQPAQDQSEPEAIIAIAPPPITIPLGLELPTRNPRR